MSLATTCPACGTCFRVVQDQLKVSEGWVRCGHCQEVFNALEGLFELDPPAPAPEPEPQPTAEPRPEPALEPPTDPVAGWEAPPSNAQGSDEPAQELPPPHDASGSVEAMSPQPTEPTPDAARAASGTDQPELALTHSWTHSVAEPPGLVPLSPGPDDRDTVGNEPGDPDGASAVEPAELDADLAARLRNAAPQEEAPPAAVAPSPPAEAAPDFVQQAERRARWERPGMRALLATLGLVLGLGIVAQVAWHWRDRLAYAWPAARPVLAMACGELGCTLQAPHLIDALVVDNAAMVHPPGAEAYRLSVTLHNRADHPIALPHLELTLTDAQGIVVTKRVLSPVDFHQAPDDALGPQADAAWSLMFVPTDPSRISGYTVAAFYP